MRADRLLSLMLLLRHRGRMSATALAAELEVSTRTVLRDVEALSTAGIPVYAERGRAGGFTLLPGFTTDLTGLTTDEALALLTASGRTGAESLGVAPAWVSAMRKVVATMPDAPRAAATRAADRITVRRDGFLRAAEPDGPLDVVRRAVFAGHRVRLHHGRDGAAPEWRTVDPIGLVSAAGRWYLLAMRDGEDRTYRVSRIHAAVELDEAAERPADVDLEHLWERRRAAFAASIDRLRVVVRVRVGGRDALVRDALVRDAEQLHDERPDGDGVRLELTFGGLGHAVGTLWRLGTDVEAIAPAELRQRLAERAAAVAALYPVP